MDLGGKSGFTYMDLDDFEEYLADKPEHEKWELIGGRVVKMMVGARWSHHRIVRNIDFSVTSRLRERNSPCRTYTESFWLKERFVKLAVFPDVMVHCGPFDRDATSLSDPVVLFEVVSPGSAVRDRVEKGGLYLRLPSLQHFVLVDRDQASLQLVSRLGSRGWTEPQEPAGLDQGLALPGIEVELPVAEIYRDVLA